MQTQKQHNIPLLPVVVSHVWMAFRNVYKNNCHIFTWMLICKFQWSSNYQHIKVYENHMKTALVLWLRRKRIVVYYPWMCESTHYQQNTKDTDVEKAFRSCDVTTKVVVNQKRLWKCSYDDISVWNTFPFTVGAVSIESLNKLCNNQCVSHSTLQIWPIPKRRLPWYSWSGCVIGIRGIREINTTRRKSEQSFRRRRWRRRREEARYVFVGFGISQKKNLEM